MSGEYGYLPESLELAARLGASTLFEASGQPLCSVDSDIRPVWSGAAVVGPAFPVACAPGDNLAIQIALEQAPAGSVMVVTTSSFLAGYWGEVLSVAAQARGIAGLVIDGGVRDVEAMEKLAFPVFSRGVCVRGTLKDSVLSVGEPINLAGTPVAQGDLVVADGDGVVILEHDSVGEVLECGYQREEKEAVMMEELKQGATTLELMGLTQWRAQV